MSSVFNVFTNTVPVVAGSMEFVDASNSNTTFFRLTPATSAASLQSTVDMSGAGTILVPNGYMQYSKTVVTAAQMVLLASAPITLVAAPGTGKFIKILDCIFYLNYGGTAYTSGSTLQVVENSIAVATTTNTLIQTASAVAIQAAFPGLGTTASIGAANSAVTLGVSSTNFATGNSPVDVHLFYTVVTL